MRRAVAACVGVMLLAASMSAWPADFRIYRANENLQQDRVPAMNEDEPGCHNLLLRLTVYRVAQIGYEYCSVYAENDCEAGTEISVTWKKEESPVTRFTPGARWFLVSGDPRGRKMGSWYCEARE